MKKYKNYNVRVDRNAQIDAMTLPECREYIKQLDGVFSDALNKITNLEIEVEQLRTRGVPESYMVH